ncbi:MAG: hypothetical protein ACRD2Z_01385 [Thermoanaerobaculia bacterium]
MQGSSVSSRKRIVTGLFVLFAVWYVYRASPVRQISDAHYTVLASWALIDGHGMVLDSYLRSGPADPVIRPGLRRGSDVHQLPYQLEQAKGHLRLRYPPGSAVLSAPLLALMRPFGYAPVDSAGLYDPEEERRIIEHLAYFIAAVFILLVYLTATELLPNRWALAIVFTAAFASPAWSTLSRGLWSHTWLAVLSAAEK